MKTSQKLKNKNQNIDRTKIPNPGRPRPFNFPEFDRFTLDNGLEVLVAQQKQLPLVSVNFCIKGSTLIDPPQKEGLANLVSQTLFEGTKDLTSTDIANQLEMLGAQYGAHTDWNSINIELNVLKHNLIPALDIYVDTIRNPNFPKHEVNRIKKELIVDRMRVADNPAKLSNEFLMKQIYGTFRYGLPIEGTLQSLNVISRNDVWKFYEKYFTPNNGTLILVGDIDITEAKNISKKYFSAWSKAATFKLSESKMTYTDRRRISLIHKSGSEQSELRIGHLGYELILNRGRNDEWTF